MLGDVFAHVLGDPFRRLFDRQQLRPTKPVLGRRSTPERPLPAQIPLASLLPGSRLRQIPKRFGRLHLRKTGRLKLDLPATSFKIQGL